MASDISKDKSGHRERMRDQFISGDGISHTDEALLELLLTYTIPQKDVQPLAKELISKFGSIENVLAADVETLCSFDGVKAYSATLLKLVDWIRIHHSTKSVSKEKTIRQKVKQSTLFEPIRQEPEKLIEIKEHSVKPFKKASSRYGTGMFGKAVLKEAIELLPTFPDKESLDDIREFVRNNLHFSAEQTRRRYADYIIRRMFPYNHADKVLRLFAVKYAGRQELKDVCYYRFCKAEPLMYDIIDTIFLPSIGIGRLNRVRLREYLSNCFPASKSIIDGAKAIVDALAAGGIVRADHTTISFSYRDVLIPSFAFILHSEFPEPGMYDISKLESNGAIRSMFWNPSRIMPSLYELRNQGIISKVSDIDNIRQFTTRWTLDELAAKIT